MNLFRIQTSAWTEEDFFLVTNLTEEQIESVISPLVEAERESDDLVTNEKYCEALQNAYPTRLVMMYQDVPNLTF